MMELLNHQTVNKAIFKKLNLKRGLVSKQEIAMEETQCKV